MQFPIETYRLPNGLRVVLSEDHAAPIVAVNLWYHVGSGHERAGRTGFAHLFEHMLFQGSEHVGANQHFELVQRAGGTLNGSTWYDRTNYFETLPSHYVELALWLEADRMGHLLPAMTQEKLDNQRDVVKNERRWTVDNQPYGTWTERLPALAFPASHPFHHSILGSMEDLDAATLDDISAFFRTHYTPDNAVLTIAGDFDAAAVRAMVTRHFGPIPRGPGAEPLGSTVMPPVFGAPLREVIQDDVPLARVFVAFRVPPFGSDGWYAAAVCGAILGYRRGSRLYRALVREQQVASDVGTFTFDLTKGADLLVVDASARPGIDAPALEAAIVRTVDRLIADGATPSETDRALALVETDFIAAMQGAQERADRLSLFTTYFDDPARLNGELARFRAVAPAAVTAFARERLVATNRATLIYVPREATS